MNTTDHRSSSGWGYPVAIVGFIAVGYLGGIATTDAWSALRIQHDREALHSQRDTIEALKATQGKRLERVEDFCKHYQD
jgi:hypothetical protein